MSEGSEIVRKYYEQTEDEPAPLEEHGPWGEWRCAHHGSPASPPGRGDIAPGWEKNYAEALYRMATAISRRRAEYLQIEKLESALQGLTSRLDRLEGSQSVIVPITTLAPEPFDLLKDIKVVVQRSDDECVATFFDANVNATGCNETEAIQNLKDVMLDLFEHLGAQQIKRLGPGPAKQLAILRSFIKKRG